MVGEARNRRGVHRSRREPGTERPSKSGRRGACGACFIGKELPGLGEFDPTCAALKQFHPKLLFEILDLPTQRRLGDVKPPRRLRHVAKLGDDCEITQMAKFHTAAHPKSIAGSGTRYWVNLRPWSTRYWRRATRPAGQKRNINIARQNEDLVEPRPTLRMGPPPCCLPVLEQSCRPPATGNACGRCGLLPRHGTIQEDNHGRSTT